MREIHQKMMMEFYTLKDCKYWVLKYSEIATNVAGEIFQVKVSSECWCVPGLFLPKETPQWN